MRYFLYLFLCIAISTPLRSEEDKPKAQVISVSEESLFDTYAYPVSLEAENESEVHAEISSVIKDMKVKLGDSVQAGQPLLLLQHTKMEYSQVPVMVKSPIGGQIAAISKKKGARIEAGELLLHIVSRENLLLRFEIPEMEVNTLSLGLPGTLTFLSLPGQTFTCALQGISPRIDTATGTATGELRWNEKASAAEKKLRTSLYPGMLGRLEFHIHKRKALVIPKRAVSMEKNTRIARIVQENKVIKRTIQTGKEFFDRVEVVKGLQANDILVLQSSQYLREGETVQIEKYEKKK